MSLKIQSCVTEIQEVASEIGRPPTQTEYRNHKDNKAPTAQDIRLKIGSWEGALVMAGLNPDEMNTGGVHQNERPSYRLEDVIKAVQYVTENVDGQPTVTDYKEYRRQDDPTMATIYNRFDNKENVWEFVCETAGVKEEGMNQYKEYADKECLNAIERVYEELDRKPSQSDYKIMSDSDEPSLSTIKNRFNGWVPAVSEAIQDT